MSTEEIHTATHAGDHSEDTFAATSADSSDAFLSLVEHAQAAVEPDSAPKDFRAFYGLQDNPFADSVNPVYFYQTAAHADALQGMLDAATYETSLAMVTGPSGTGKTLLTQMLIGQLDSKRYHPILVLVSPGLSKTGLLREILSELNVALPAGISRTQDLLKILSNTIIDLHEENRSLVIIIDECHFLSADNLHIVRTISNLETPQRKLTTCLLFGEERFTRRLQHPAFASLSNRMFFKRELPAMTESEMRQYISFRTLAGGCTRTLFDDGALVQLFERTHGVCRDVNRLCMLSLLDGSRHGLSCIGADVVARQIG